MTTATFSQRRRLSKRPRGTTLPHLLWFLAGALVCLTHSCGAQQEQPTQTAISQSRQVHKYALPAFSMVLRVTVEDDAITGDDDDDIYLDLEIFQETLEHVTEFHLTDIFQQHPHSFPEEQFIRVQLSSKVRQEINQDATPRNRNHVPLHAGFSGVVSYSFPSVSVPNSDEVDAAIAKVLEDALVAENYLLLFRRYLSSGILADIEDVYEIRIGTEQLTVLETSTSGTKPNKNDNNSGEFNSSSSSNNMNAVTIVAIVIFLTLSCLLLMFGATIVLLMKDRAKQEQTLNGQTMTSIGMGAGKKKKKTGDGEEGEEEDGTEEDDDSSTEETPAWKRAVLPILRKAIMVRRYWRKQIRKQRKARRRNKGGEEVEAKSTDPNGGTSSDDSSNAAEPEDDDGLNDEDVYYDDALSDEEAANQWLDAWQASITSIPVRSVKSSSGNANKNLHNGSPNKKHVKKKKTSKAPMAPRPATRQSKKAFLCCIAEEDSVVDGSVMDPNDIELGDSIRSSATAASGRSSSRSISNQPELDRIQELTSVVMEEDYPTTTFGSSARKKKQAKPLEVPDLSTPFSEDEDSGPIQDIDLT